jgi:hypothetical protein
MDANREMFFALSEALVERADNIRLEFIRIGKTFDKRQLPFLNNSKLFVDITMSQFDPFWKRSKQAQDPDAEQARYKNLSNFTLSTRVSF